MIKLRILFLPVFLLFLLCGCVQTLHNTPLSQDADFLPDRTGDADSNECIEKVSPKEQKPSRVDNLPAENTIEDQTSIHNKEDENKIAENSLSEKKIQSIFDEALFCQASQDFWQKGELENALEALDHAYSLILKVDTDDTAELIQQKEDLRYLISKRILEIYASRNIVVNGNHNAIPMVNTFRMKLTALPKKAKKNSLLNRTNGPENIDHKLFLPLKKPAFRLNCHGSRLLKADSR